MATQHTKINEKQVQDAMERAFVGFLENEQGQAYGSIYDVTRLTQEEKDAIVYGVDGSIQRDVWSQVMFTDPEQ